MDSQVPRERQRVAVLALQRLGDVVTAARVTDALSRRRDTAGVELLHWDQTEQAAALLPGVAARHRLPFTGLRRRARVHAIAALRTLSTHVDAITAEGGFDVVVNLSSTRFSCWLAPALLAEGGRVLGPSIDALGRYVPSHDAIDHLNGWGVDPRLSSFAHQDLYALAAGVRLAGWSGLREGNRRRRGPVVVHPFGSERSKDWRTPDDWRQLVAAIPAALGQRVVVVGAPSERAVLASIAAGTAAGVETCSLADYTALLADAHGLISVDTVAIHLAAQVGCPTVVLRQGVAGGLAFVPGPAALCVDADPEPAQLADVLALALRQFSPAPVPLHAHTELLRRVRVREGFRDDHGMLGLRTPSWCHAPPQAHDDDANDSHWRAMWRCHFAGVPATDSLWAACAAGRGRFGALRWQALLSLPDRLGAAARAFALRGQVAAHRSDRDDGGDGRSAA